MSIAIRKNTILFMFFIPFILMLLTIITYGGEEILSYQCKGNIF